MEGSADFKWVTETFSDKKIIRYVVPGFEKLSVQQKRLVYYLAEAGYSGRDIIYAQHHRFNLVIRKTFENIFTSFSGDKESHEWKEFVVYLKQVWFSNGIHHHYSGDKFIPGFSRSWLEERLKEVKASFDEEVFRVLFDATVDAKLVDTRDGVDNVACSAVNFYAPGISADKVRKFYHQDVAPEEPLERGINSRIELDANGNIVEVVMKSGGLYGAALDRVIYWLEKAVEVAENEPQGKAMKLLVEYFRKGDLTLWRDYNIAWAQATEGDVDYILGFVEVYNDPLAHRGSYECIVQVKDAEASERMKVLSDNAQWFEDHSPLFDAHKKKNVSGVSYKVINTVAEAGDASPSTPIGVNLPNSDWIRSKFGSKSVSLGNIEDAYDKASSASFLDEFLFDDGEKERSKKHGDLSGKVHTALHEVLGHASGILEPGVQDPHTLFGNYHSVLEEARADLFALYYILDQKLVELKVLPSLEVGKAEYEGYIRNGLMLQLRRIRPGNSLEEAHMRNRQLNSLWAYEHGKAENVIEKVKRDGKTYFRVNNYERLRELFGQLLKEIQRIKSQGDVAAGKALVEKYGVQVDKELHAEVLERSAKLAIPPYGGFINPRLVPVNDANGNITDVKIEYPDDFTQQMLEYAKKYSHL